ncbi:MAG: hypothetical protein Q4D96_09135 [Propionibacteriaceae bacterium]|nr:hypothetical protein [Propionibacteriaceae bacterium]
MTTNIITWSEINLVVDFYGIDAYGQQTSEPYEACVCSLWVTEAEDLDDTEQWVAVDSLSLNNRDADVDFEDPEPYRLIEEKLARRNGLEPSSLIDATNW